MTKEAINEKLNNAMAKTSQIISVMDAINIAHTMQGFEIPTQDGLHLVSEKLDEILGELSDIYGLYGEIA